MPAKPTTSNSNDPNSLCGYLAILGNFELHTLFALDQPVFSAVTHLSLPVSIQSCSQSRKSAAQSDSSSLPDYKSDSAGLSCSTLHVPLPPPMMTGWHRPMVEVPLLGSPKNTLEINKEKEEKEKKAEKCGRGKEKKERKGLKKAETPCKACVKDQPQEGQIDEENPIKIVSSKSVQQPLCKQTCFNMEESDSTPDFHSSGSSCAVNNKHNLLSIIGAPATLLSQLECCMEREIAGLKHWEKDLLCQIDILKVGAHDLQKDFDDWQNILNPFASSSGSGANWSNSQVGDIGPDMSGMEVDAKKVEEDKLEEKTKEEGAEKEAAIEGKGKGKAT
ncbi:hypothetical protein DL96DRAFT_1723275 [Flagelloscypha sp. PMI_526]|nr:hypothetical protein DL96DRAFT_1723275 [Flagelloscypha sp. PMI_526]